VTVTTSGRIELPEVPLFVWRDRAAVTGLTVTFNYGGHGAAVTFKRRKCWISICRKYTMFGASCYGVLTGFGIEKHLAADRRAYSIQPSFDEAWHHHVVARPRERVPSFPDRVPTCLQGRSLPPASLLCRRSTCVHDATAARTRDHFIGE
jgi:hypothetical protein